MYTIKDHSFSAQPTASEIALTLKPNDYATCIFDGFWWLVLVDSIDLEEKDETCKFMHPHAPTNNFHWPRPDDIGHVPFNKFIMTAETPQCSSNGRQFLVKVQTPKHTNSVFENLK